MKIRVIDLVNMISGGNIPKRIKFADTVLTYDEKSQNYTFKYDNYDDDGSLNWDYIVFHSLNEEVLILGDEECEEKTE